MSRFQKATKTKARLRMALIGVAGSGKTFSALSIGTNLVPGGRVAVIDTECGSAALYGSRFDFDAMNLERHSPLDYVEAIEAAESEGYDVLIVDSLSHAWIGKDGALAQVDQAAERGGNSFSAWRHVTPKHLRLVDKILTCKMHLIATVRAKTEYVQEKNDKGKTEIKKLGMAAVQRDGLEFEFDCVGDLDQSNTLKISKTRLDGVVSPCDIYERPGLALATKIRDWLNDGAAPATRTAPATAPALPDPVGDAIDAAFASYLAAISNATTQADLDAAATGPNKPARGSKQYDVAVKAYLTRQAALKGAA